jgi:RNA polymerase sigma-70 factor (ECF subfamily)
LSDSSERNDVVRSLDGDRDAYARIVARYQTKIARHMRLFTRDPAIIEQLVQDVFVDAYFSLNGFRGEGALGAWIGRIATRVGYRYWKQNRRKNEVPREDHWWRELAEQEVDNLDPTAANRLVHSLLETLPPRDRLVLVLMYVDGRSVDEAAQLAGWSKTMIKVQAFRARRKLRALFAGLGVNSVQAAFEFSQDIVHERP